MHEVIPVEITFHPRLRNGIYMGAVQSRVLDGVVFNAGMSEVKARAEQASSRLVGLSNGLGQKIVPNFNAEVSGRLNAWIRPPTGDGSSLELSSQNLKAYSHTAKLYEIGVPPRIANALVPWMDGDMWDPRQKLLGLNPEDVRHALKKNGVVRPDELIGDDPVQTRVAFLCAGSIATHPETVKVNMCPQQIAFFENGLNRPDLIYKARPAAPGRVRIPN